MRLRLLTLAGLVLACVLVASGASTAAAATAEAHSASSGKSKAKRTHHARHRSGRKHKRRHHRRRAVTRHTAETGVNGVSTAPAAAAPAAGSGGSGGSTTTTTSGGGSASVTAVAASCPGASSQPSAANLAAVRAATLCLVNQQRAAAGVGPLADNGALATAAQGHSDDMVASRFFDHTNLAGASPFDRIAAAGYGYSRAAENIAYGGGASGTPAQIVSLWMNSPGHRANILDGALAESGIGINPGTPSGGAGGTYTQDFGTR